MIEYKNVTVGFEGSVVLNNINLLIDRKSVILGPNGSGKTTLIKATTGLCPYKGNIYRWTRSEKHEELFTFLYKSQGGL